MVDSDKKPVGSFKRRTMKFVVNKKKNKPNKIAPVYTNNKPSSVKQKKTTKSFEDSKSSKSILFLILLLFVFLLVLIFLYFYYRDIPTGEVYEVPIVINKSFDSFNETTGPVKQFYSNMKFNHNNISYSIDKDCNINHRSRMIAAFNELSDEIDSIKFTESILVDEADINVLCPSDGSNVYAEEENDFFVAGEGGAKQIIQTKRYNIIKNGAILLYENPENKLVCSWPNVELHELIHVFGFNHSSDENSLMHPILKSCDQRLDKSIVNDLKKLYSEKNLPDLYFEDINVVKKGKLIDFNLTVRNSGSTPSDLANFSVFDSGKLIKTSTLGDLNYGAGVFVQIVNFKLNSKDPDKISFVIDSENSIEEIDEQNNRVDIDFK